MKRFLLLLLIVPLFLGAQSTAQINSAAQTNFSHSSETNGSSFQNVKKSTHKWAVNPEKQKAFIENKGQFDGRNWQSINKIEYAAKQGLWYTFFSKKGLTYRLDKLIRNPNKKKGDHDAPSRVHISELVHVTWIGSNSNVQIVAENKTDYYNSYAIKDSQTKDVVNLNNVNGYKKITYKNLYNNIDVEYVFHKDGGIKYNIILKPNADPSQIKMQYKSSHTNISGEYSNISLNSLGQLEIKTSITDIIEHKPKTFYSTSKVNINSKYNFNNNILSFQLDNYDNSQEVVIDPWIVTPTWDDGDFTREVETDGAGNVYVIGGETPMQLRKYSIAGALIWTYNTPWDTTGGSWLGTLATDQAGVSYITQGTGPELERVSTAGAMVWHNNAPAFHEYWTITFNCDNTKLIVGGTDVIPFAYEATIWDIDLNNGNQLASVEVGTQGGFTPIEVRSIAPTKNSKYVYLTHTEVGLMNQNLTACSATPDFEVDNTHNLAYKCENYLSSAQNGGGLKALVANDNYYYTHRGDQILQWDITNGNLLNTVALPGGSSNAGFGGRVVHCSGLDVDVNGNVYAGSMDRVVKFDANLNVLSQSFTTGGFTVYDVDVNSNGEVIAGGALLDNGTSTGRGGRIESLSMTAGGQYSTVCCDPNFCAVGPLCTTDAAVNLNPNTGGGTWSSNPVTAGLNTSTGVFDPSVAGAGSYIITYTLTCGSFATTINVTTCIPMSICVEANGDLTVSGGTPNYTWYEGTMSPSCVSGFSSFCGPFTAAGPLVMQWTSFGTGTTITPPVGADTIKVVDNLGDSIISFDISTLPPCSAGCDATITPAGPFCENDAAVILTAAQGGGTWGGPGITNTSTGAFDPAIAGPGTHNITYVLGCGDNDAISIVVNPLPDSGIDGTAILCSGASSVNLLDSLGGSPDAGGSWSGPSGLTGGDQGIFDPSSNTAGTYTYTVTNGCGSSSNDVVVTINPAPSTGTFGSTNFCPTDPAADLFNQLNGSPDNGGIWTGPSVLANGDQGTFDPASNLAGTYLYTVTNSCGIDTASVTVTISSNPSPGTNGVAELCANATSVNLLDSLGGTPTAGGTWTGPSGLANGDQGTFDPATNAAGTYTYTITDCASNPLTADVIVTINTAPNTGTDGAISLCNTDPTTDLFNQLGGIPDLGGTWSPAMASGTGMFDPAADPAGTYTYTLTNSCGSSSNDVVVTITSCSVPTGGYTVSDSIICEGECVDFTDQSAGATSWLWTFNGGTPNTSTNQNPANICFAGPGTYTIEQISTNGNGSDTITSLIVVNSTPTVNAGSDVTVELGQSANLNATGTNGTYTWSPPTWLSCVVCVDPIATPDETITYTVTVVDSNGCSASDEVTVIVDFDYVIWVPNIFSPNGDGNNDILFVRGAGVAQFKFFLYNRWGEKVFETQDLTVGWNGKFRGKKMNNAVFVYYLEATFKDGTEVSQKGDITLIR